MNITWQTTNEQALQTLGERLKALRLAAGHTQRRLAELCGVSVPVVVRMESGDGGVRIATWLDALRALGQLQNLEQLIPEVQPTPYDFAEVSKPKRQRAPRSDRKLKTNDWKWGD